MELSFFTPFSLAYGFLYICWVIINYRIKHVDMNKKSILWSALKQKAEDLQIFLESNNVKNPITETLEGIAVILQLTALCTVHCSHQNMDW